MSAAKRTKRMKRTSRRRLLAAFSLCFLSGCATAPGGKPQIPFISAEASTPIDPLAPLAPPEARIWPDTAQDVLNQRARGFGLVYAPELQRYLNTLYARVKTQAGVPTWPGDVYIVANDSLNAYATAAGNIYVYLPWLTSVESEDELVAVLSHEFGHVYLHYHQLEGAIEGADMAAGGVGIGVSIAKKTDQVTGWNQLDSLMAVYSLGKGLATTVYSRSQESAADSFGLNVSLKLHYSYEHGFKAFLERMATWETNNQEREARRQEKLREAIRTEAMVKAQKAAGGGKTPDAVQLQIARANGEVQGTIAATLQSWSSQLEQAMNKLNSDHPAINERIDALARSVDAFPAAQTDADPIVAPLQVARADKRTAAILANYEIAFKALDAPADPSSLAAARRATTGPTATHAVPLYALYTVLSAQPAAQNRRRVDAGQLFEANFRSDQDRAWKLYLVRGAEVKATSGVPAAKKVIEAGMAYFSKAQDAWPDAIHFYGETSGWDEAKRHAAECRKHFQHGAARCTAAAVSPAEQAEADRKAKAKADNLIGKYFPNK